MAAITALEPLRYLGPHNKFFPFPKKKKNSERAPTSPVRSRVHLWHRGPIRNHTWQDPRVDRGEAIPQKKGIPVSKEGRGPDRLNNKNK